MKGAVTFWVVGCIIVGLSYGYQLRECPQDKELAQTIAIAVAIWPALLVANILAPATHGCKKLTS